MSEVKVLEHSIGSLHGYLLVLLINGRKIALFGKDMVPVGHQATQENMTRRTQGNIMVVAQ